MAQTKPQIHALISDFNGTIIPGYLELGLIVKWYVVTHFYEQYKASKRMNLAPLIELTEHLKETLIKYQDYIDGKDYDSVARQIERVVSGMDADYVEEYFMQNRSQRGKIQRYLFFLSMFKPGLKKFLHLFDASADKTVLHLVRKAVKRHIPTAIYSSALAFPILHYMRDNKAPVDHVYGNEWYVAEQDAGRVIAFGKERVNREDKFLTFPALLHTMGLSSGKGIMYVGDNEPELRILKYVEYPIVSRFARPAFVSRVRKEIPHAFILPQDRKKVYKLIS